MRALVATSRWMPVLICLVFTSMGVSPVWACSGMSGGAHNHIDTAEAADGVRQTGHPGGETIPGRRAAGQPEVRADEVWTCPMHPQVKASFKTRCPECGMDLVKVEVPSGQTTGH